jgi:hypothetical protein
MWRSRVSIWSRYVCISIINKSSFEIPRGNRTMTITVYFSRWSAAHKRRLMGKGGKGGGKGGGGKGGYEFYSTVISFLSFVSAGAHKVPLLDVNS